MFSNKLMEIRANPIDLVFHGVMSLIHCNHRDKLHDSSLFNNLRSAHNKYIIGLSWCGHNFTA